MAYENIEHFVLSCPYFNEMRAKTFNDIRKIPKDAGNKILDSTEPIVNAFLGKIHPQVVYDDMIPFWIISCRWISTMYRIILKNRRGIG